MKWLLKSKTVIGILVSFLPTFLPAIGIAYNPESGALINSTIDVVIQVSGLLFGLFGRWSAGGVWVVSRD